MAILTRQRPSDPAPTAHPEPAVAGLFALARLLARHGAQEWLAAQASDAGSAADEAPK
jgi:hypothetical protein